MTPDYPANLAEYSTTDSASERQLKYAVNDLREEVARLKAELDTFKDRAFAENAARHEAEEALSACKRDIGVHFERITTLEAESNRLKAELAQANKSKDFYDSLQAALGSNMTLGEMIDAYKLREENAALSSIISSSQKAMMIANADADKYQVALESAREALRAIIEVTSTTSIGDHNESYIQEIAEKALASRETK